MFPCPVQPSVRVVHRSDPTLQREAAQCQRIVLRADGRGRGVYGLRSRRHSPGEVARFGSFGLTILSLCSVQIYDAPAPDPQPEDDSFDGKRISVQSRRWGVRTD